jgi:pimeloyl-ACP methyl ester carboxylesterase
MRQALVYLPGLDGTGRLLHRQPRLHNEYEVTCVAYPQEPSATYEQLADLGGAALEASRGRLPGIVLAESFGGAVALTLALRRPELLERLVLVNTFAYFPRRLIIDLLAALGPWMPDRPSNPMTRGLRGLVFFGPDIPPPEREEWWRRTEDVPMSAFGWRLPMVAALDMRPRLASIEIPSLVFVAPNDLVVPPSAGHDLARRLPRARMLQMRTGHTALIHPRVDIARWLAADWA